MIMSMFVGFGFRTYTRQIQSSLFDKEVDAFVSTLQLLKEKAINRDLSHNPTCENFNNFYIRLFTSTNPDRYRRGFECYPTTGTQYTLFGDTNFSATTYYRLNNSTPADTNFKFFHPYGCASSTCDSGARTVTFRNEALNKCKNVSVSNLGTITLTEVTCP